MPRYLKWYQKSSPSSKTRALPGPAKSVPNKNSIMYSYFNKESSLTTDCTFTALPGQLEQSVLWMSVAFCCLCLPPLPSHIYAHTPSFVNLSFGCDWQTPELWKGRKSLRESQRYFYHRLCSPPHIYENKNAFTQQKKSIESSKEQFLYSSQQPVLSLAPFSMGCWLLAVCW